MKREEAIKEMREKLPWLTEDTKRLVEALIPELAESEDERIRKVLIDALKTSKSVGELKFILPEPTREECIAYLEKQKDLNKMIVVSPEVWDTAIADAYENGKKDGEKQKEPHYTKRNALFDKCVENCDPNTVEEVNKRVDDIMNMPKLSPFEQALTNFIGDWEDDEEHWPSKFVKKHGKYILDIAREELQKEQKPAEWSEEDKKVLAVISYKISQHQGNDERSLFTPDEAEFIDGMEDKLKSLYHSWKPSAQELGALKTAVLVLTEKRTFPKAAEQIQKIIDVFDGKELRKDWKPSEEQMGALKKALYINPASGKLHYLKENEVCILQGLLKQLENL